MVILGFMGTVLIGIKTEFKHDERTKILSNDSLKIALTHKADSLQTTIDNNWKFYHSVQDGWIDMVEKHLKDN
jgi:hypothetical protein